MMTNDLHLCSTLAGGKLPGRLLYKLAEEYMRYNRSNWKFIEKDGKMWLAHNRADWRKYYGLNGGLARTAIQILKDRGLIDVDVYDVDGAPSIHIKPSDKFWNILMNQYER